MYKEIPCQEADEGKGLQSSEGCTLNPKPETLEGICLIYWIREDYVASVSVKNEMDLLIWRVTLPQ